jgi:preprotein translocase subunit Sec63
MYQSQNNIFIASLSYADISIKKFVDERIIMLIKLFSINVKVHIFKRLDQKLYRVFSKLRRSF